MLKYPCCGYVSEFPVTFYFSLLSNNNCIIMLSLVCQGPEVCGNLHPHWTHFSESTLVHLKAGDWPSVDMVPLNVVKSACSEHCGVLCILAKIIQFNFIYIAPFTLKIVCRCFTETQSLDTQAIRQWQFINLKTMYFLKVFICGSFSQYKQTHTNTFFF